MLRRAEVQGSDDELDAAVREYEGYALSLILLGEYLKEFLDGDIAWRDQVPVLHEETRTGGHAFRVMEAYDVLLSRDGRIGDRQILRMLGLFDRPCPRTALTHCVPNRPFRATTVVSKLTEKEWDQAVRATAAMELDRSGESTRRRLTRRPPVGARVLRAEASGANRRRHSNWLMVGFLTILLGLPETSDTLEEMVPVFLAIHHGCRAGRYREATQRLYRDTYPTRESGLLPA